MKNYAWFYTTVAAGVVVAAMFGGGCEHANILGPGTVTSPNGTPDPGITPSPQPSWSGALENNCFISIGGAHTCLNGGEVIILRTAVNNAPSGVLPYAYKNYKVSSIDLSSGLVLLADEYGNTPVWYTLHSLFITFGLSQVVIPQVGTLIAGHWLTAKLSSGDRDYRTQTLRDDGSVEMYDSGGGGGNYFLSSIIIVAVK